MEVADHGFRRRNACGSPCGNDGGQKRAAKRTGTREDDGDRGEGDKREAACIGIDKSSQQKPSGGHAANPADDAERKSFQYNIKGDLKAREADGAEHGQLACACGDAHAKRRENDEDGGDDDDADG